MNGPRRTHGRRLSLADRLRIDEVCNRFEADCRAGLRPDLAGFLDGVTGPAREPLFAELLALELEYRAADDPAPTAGPYLDRFPGYGDVIAEALAPAGASGRTTVHPDVAGAARPSAEDAGEFEALRAAGYEVTGELGRGGMGVVYQARQVALGREVALKVIRAGGFASATERLRFRNEAETVARFDHPNIVPVYEVGRSRGLDYFSMKRIAGASLDRRLAEYADDPRAAARLVAAAAGAVHHAHQRGVLHRDLKPANLLVDALGAPHVTDFGLARPVGSDPGLTHSGAIVGTPSYMSPEQADGGAGSLTTATDVYGLGSVLYALLTGRAPHAGGGLAETLDRVRSASPAPPSKANPKVARDLEVISLKCLEKDARRRYASAQELADDLTRWLAGEPIAARPVGAPARAWMWCRRHPVPAALGVALAASLAAGGAGVAWKWREADGQRAAKSRVAAFWTKKVLAGASTELNPRAADVTLVEVLDLAASRVAGDFGDDPGVEAEVRETVGEAYRSLGEYGRAEPHLRAAVARRARADGPGSRATLHATNLLADLLDRMGRSGEAEPLLRRNLAAARRALGPDDPTTLDAGHGLAVALGHRGRGTEAEGLLRQTLAARRRVLPADHSDTLRSVNALGLILQARGGLDEADALANEYEHGIRCARGPNHPDNVVALANLARLRRNQGLPAQAEAFHRRAWDEARRILGDDHPAALDAAAEYAGLLLDNGKAGESADVLRGVVAASSRVRGERHPATRAARDRLGRAAGSHP